MDDQMFLVHKTCGEAFDSLETAASHISESGDPTCDLDPNFYLLPESEAM